MSELGVKMLLFVYLFIALSLATALIIGRVILRKSNSQKAAARQTVYVTLLIAVAYLLPILAIINAAIMQDPLTITAIGLIMAFSTIPMAKLVIIPLSDRHRLKSVEKEFGKDSDYANYLRKKIKNNKNNVTFEVFSKRYIEEKYNKEKDNK